MEDKKSKWHMDKFQWNRIFPNPYYYVYIWSLTPGGIGFMASWLKCKIS